MRSRILLSLLALPSLAGAALATGTDSPASLLLFPEYRSGTGHMTIITVTNTRTGTNGAVDVHFVYIDGATCSEFDRNHHLTANDTFSVVASFDNANHPYGYLFVYAQNAASQPISFNYLIGSQLQLDSADPLNHFNYSYNPIGYKAIAADDMVIVGNGDNFRNLDGIEYEKSANDILIPQFFGQDPMRGVQGQLVLLNLAGGNLFQVHVNFVVYDDSEHPNSADYYFTCWTKVPLHMINGVFDQSYLHGISDATSTVGGASPNLETGWMRIHADIANPTNGGGNPIVDPAIIAVLDQQLAGYSIADTPYLINLTNATGRLFSIPTP